jgi:hypothetical protein
MEQARTNMYSVLEWLAMKALAATQPAAPRPQRRHASSQKQTEDPTSPAVQPTRHLFDPLLCFLLSSLARSLRTHTPPEVSLTIYRPQMVILSPSVTRLAGEEVAWASSPQVPMVRAIFHYFE